MAEGGGGLSGGRGCGGYGEIGLQCAGQSVGEARGEGEGDERAVMLEARERGRKAAIMAIVLFRSALFWMMPETAGKHAGKETGEASEAGDAACSTSLSSVRP